MRTLIFIFCLFGSVSIMAQGDWYVGASATPYSYWLYNSDAMASDRFSYETDLFGVNGFQGQLLFGYSFYENLSLETGLIYCWQVQRFDASRQNSSDEFSFHQSQYVGIPFSFEIRLLKEELIQPYFRIGFQFKYLVDYFSRIEHQYPDARSIAKFGQERVHSQFWDRNGYRTREFESNGVLREFIFGNHLGLGVWIAGENIDWRIGLIGNWDWSEVLNEDYFLDDTSTPEDDALESTVYSYWPDTEARTTHIWVGLEVGVRYYW